MMAFHVWNVQFNSIHNFLLFLNANVPPRMMAFHVWNVQFNSIHNFLLFLNANVPPRAKLCQ